MPKYKIFLQKNLRISKKSSTFAPAFVKNATVAQLVEQRIRNAWVGGSSPPSGSKENFGSLFYIVSMKNFCLRLKSAIPMSRITKMIPAL